MFDLYKIQPFRPILLVSEQVVDGQSRPCRTPEETYAAAQYLVQTFLERSPAPATTTAFSIRASPPSAATREGNLKRLIGAMKLIHADAALAGMHASVGLSNFTVMLPSKRADGSPVKGPLESAFLTKVMPLGLDMVIGSVKRTYDILPPDHPAMRCIEDCLKLEGFDVPMRVRDFYA